MTVNRTTLLDLPLPVTGTESGAWGDITNNGLTQYLDIAIAGTLVLNTDADVTLTSTEGDSSATYIGATTAQYAILRWTATGSTTRNITALAQSKTYVVINATGGTQSIVLRGAGPTTGVTIISGEKAFCVWNGSDFVKVSSSAAAGGSNTQVQYNSSGVLAGVSGATTNGTAITFSTTNLKLQGSSTGVSSFASANSSATDYTVTFPAASTTIPIATQTLTFSGPTAARTITLPDANFTAARTDAAQTFTGTQTFSSDPVLSGGTANGVLYLNGSKVATSGSALTFDGTNFATTGTASATKFIPTGGTATGNGMYLPTSNELAWSNNGSETMRLTSTGLGIGTSSPASYGGRLVVESNGVTDGITVGDLATPANNTSLYLRSTGLSKIYTALGGAITFGANGGNEYGRFDSSGNLGLGVTPSAWASSYKVFQIGSTASLVGATNFTFLNTNVYFDSSDTPRYLTTAAVTRYQQDGGAHKWYTAASGTAGNAITFTQAMTLDANGNLLVGATSGSGKLHVESTSVSQILARNPSASSYASIRLYNDQNSNIRALEIDYFGSTASGGERAEIATTGAYPLCFLTSNIERARITSGGDLLVGTTSAATSSAHNIWTGTASVTTLYIRNTNNSTPNGIVVNYSAASPNGTANEFLYCTDNSGGSTLRASIRSNGGLANYQSNNVDLSDARTKKDITPAPSYWNKIGALEIVTYKYKDQTHDDVNVGVIAQQVEQVEPVWVDADGFGETPEDGVPLKTVYTKDITFAAIKALQEAMARIETLEAKVSALEGN